MPDWGATLRNPPDSPFTPDGLTQAYQEYRLELRKFFELNSRDKGVVDDLMQTMFLQLLKDRATAPQVRDPRQYLFRSAWNVLHNANLAARRERAHFVPLDAAELEAQADRSRLLWVEDDTATAASEAELGRAFYELPKVCQVATQGRYCDDKSHREIAAELGVSVHAVKKYLLRSLAHFHKALSGSDRTPRRKGKRS